jgi:catechol 2,3-dioxygenase-like lactoylglutathione lyase family enzyme
MRAQRLFEATLNASDLTAAKRFYHDVVGLEVISDLEDRGVAFRCGSTVLLVFDPERTRVSGDLPAHGAVGDGHVAFTANASELDAWRRHLRAHGVVIESEVDWPEGGRSIYFRDPAGNVLELAPPTLWGMTDVVP